MPLTPATVAVAAKAEPSNVPRASVTLIAGVAWLMVKSASAEAGQ